MNKYNLLNVNINNKPVGKLAKTTDGLVAFEYDEQWINNGYSISPLSLPLEKRVFLPKMNNSFEGLFGVFSDSLPDGWGRLLIDRLLLKEKINPSSVDTINRLAIVGNSGMGALCYEPEHIFEITAKNSNLDELSQECKNILNTKYSEDLDELFKLGGSSGGARPKILTKIEGEDWIIKFPGSMDSTDIGKQEYDYSLCAKSCGITMPETRLFESKICSGYFGVKRFDRVDGKKIHMISVSGLLETSHRLPNLDYNTLMTLTLKLTNSYEEVGKLYRLMCFNVFAHNRDDHSKNFSFIYDETQKTWLLSPAYDLTYSSSINDEHATTIDGEGKNPTDENILAVADKIGMSKKISKEILQEVKEKTKETKKL